MNRTSPYYCRRSVLSLLISALIYAPPGMAAFTTNVIDVVNDETVDGNQKVDERGTTNNTHIINHGQQNVHGGVSNGSLIESGGYQDIGSHNNFVGQANKEGANKQVISSQADSLIKISRIWADFFPANNRISLFRL
ncbi:hypothetical protein, partial [Escherichia coli]|uniref:hypothetical protein n=1 Tax=Escherichia coli TaxID=562 RepID=UPI00201F5BC1